MTESAKQSVGQILTALALPRVGPSLIRKNLLSASEGLFDRSSAHELLTPIFKEAGATSVMAAEAKAQQTLALCRQYEIDALSIFDAHYPPRLRAIPDCPVVLFIRGRLDVLNAPLVAVVGTRKPSPVGSSYATRVARELTGLGFGVVSGLALGIDTAAHLGALKACGQTVAVLAHGLDTVSPRRNAELAARIVASGGTLVSEHPPGTPPRPPEFVRRNRLQSGLAVASIVVESGAEGGSIHQARFTRAQGRKLYAFVPPQGAPGADKFVRSGADWLMAELGAVPISSLVDLEDIRGTLVS